MPALPDLLVEQRDAVATLVINLPHKHNFLTVGCLERIAAVMEDLGRHPGVRTVVIRGAGDRAFSAGYDIRALSRVEEDLTTSPVGATLPLEKTLRAIERYPYPVVAMLNGVAYGGGCELAMACDIRVAARRVRMSMPPARLGLVYPYTGYRRFLRVVGFARTLEIFLTARVYESSECLQMGLVNHVVADEDLESFVYALAADIARNAPLSLKGTKQAVRTIADASRPAPEEEQALQSLFRASLGSDDAQEGIRAFKEKRPPRFTGK